MDTKKEPRAKNRKLKSMQVNVSKSVTKMTKGGVDIQTG